MYESNGSAPQVACLGPHLFLLFINKLPNCTPHGVSCYIIFNSKIYSFNNKEVFQLAADQGCVETFSRKTEHRIRNGRAQELAETGIRSTETEMTQSSLLRLIFHK